MTIKTHQEIRDFCLKKRDEGLTVNQISELLQKKGLKDWNKRKVRNALRPLKWENQELKEKSGETERKPKYEKTETGYVIYYGKNQKLVISDERIDEAFKLYCIADLTLEDVAIRLGITRAEFYALKTAFSIVKTSLPFAPHRIDEMTADEMAEQVRIAKKRYALQKYEKNKHSDIENEVKRLQKADYWKDEFAAKITAIDPRPYPATPITTESDIERVLVITDIHGGLEIDSPWNVYNFDVMKRRFKVLATRICATIQPCRLTIASLGDAIHGRIKGSIQKHSVNVVDSVFKVTECLSELFITLINAGFSLRIAHVNGNHCSIEKAGEDRTDEESFGRFIEWGLKAKFQQFKQVEFIETVYSMALVKIFDYSLLCCHGHQGDIKRLAELERMWRGESVIEVLAGHLHHRKIEEFNGITVFYHESFCGADQYAISKGLGGGCGCRLIEYDRRGRASERLLRLD